MPEEAALGRHTINLRWEKHGYGDGDFNVEEYRKPEFKVNITAPDTPVGTGDVVKVSIKGEYYFGQPVVNASTRVIVTQENKFAFNYPQRKWDWLYGPGYLYRSSLLDLIAGSGGNSTIFDQVLKTGPDGTLDVEISPEKYMPHFCHYKVTVEMTDASRRMVSGYGSFCRSDTSFNIFCRMDRQYYNPEDEITASVQIEDMLGMPKAGTAVARLFKLSFNSEGKTERHEIKEWGVNVNTNGVAELSVPACRVGDYHLIVSMNTAENREIVSVPEMIIVRSKTEAMQTAKELTLVADKVIYQPGDTAQLLLELAAEDGTVLLFIRPEGGTCGKPTVVHVNGHTATIPLKVMSEDLPNIFVEALMVKDGKVFTDLINILVPPEEKELDVQVDVSRKTLRPGDEAEVCITVTDKKGKPHVGSAVVTVYDAALESISGGSNLYDIKAFFWQWVRQHWIRQESNLFRGSRNYFETLEKGMYPIGYSYEYFNVERLMTTIETLGMIDSYQMVQWIQEYSKSGDPKFYADNMEYKLDCILDVMLQCQILSGAGIGHQPPLTKNDDTVALGSIDIRKDLIDTAYWNGAVETDENGQAHLKFKMPDNLTTWNVKVITVGKGTKVGSGESSFITGKDLIIRMQAPRFFVETDEVVLSANIHNYLSTTKDVQAVLELDGDNLELIDGAKQTVKIDANGEARIDWRVKAVKEGEAVVRMKALTDEESDAMQMSYPVLVHGIEKVVSFSGNIRPDGDESTIKLKIPKKRRPAETKLTIRWSPTLAGAMMDALPYLAEYPYGCTEQTLSRFLPTVMTRKTLQEMDLDLADLAKARANLNAQEIGDPAERAKQWKRYDRNPVYDQAELNKMIDFGLTKLYSMQCFDGGWGWFSGYGEYSSGHTTAYVVHGLQQALKSDLAIDSEVLNRGVRSHAEINCLL